MRKFLKGFFYIPKHGKIHDKVMLTRVATTVTIVIMCLAAMSFTAYAYFSDNVTSVSNIIKAANFEAIVSITNSNKEPVTVTKDGKIQTATLDADEYTVLLTKDEVTSTATTGFCIITIGDTDYYTQQIGNDVERGLTDGSASVKFTLKVSTATKIEILSHWGTSSCYGYENESNNSLYIESEDNIDLTASTKDNNKTPSTDGQDTTETTKTTEPSTIPSATESTNTLNESSSPSEETTPSEATETSEPATTTEPTTTQPTESSQASSGETTEQSKPSEEASDIPTTEVSN